MYLCLFRLSLRFCGGGRGEQGVTSSFTKQSEHLLTDPVDLLAECAAILHGEVRQQLTGQILLLQLLRIRQPEDYAAAPDRCGLPPERA